MHHVFPQEFNMGFKYRGFGFLIRLRSVLRADQDEPRYFY